MLSNKIIFLALVILGGAIEVGGDFILKKWAVGDGRIFLAIGLAIYAVGSIFWALSLKYEDMSKAIVIFMVLNVVLVVAGGILFWGERPSLFAKIGIALGILSIALMEL